MTERALPVSRSLSAKLFLATLLSLVCALAAYMVVYGIGTQIVNRFYMSAEAVARRKAEIDAVNTVYAPGGDHEELLNSLRKDYYEYLAKD